MPPTPRILKATRSWHGDCGERESFLEPEPIPEDSPRSGRPTEAQAQEVIKELNSMSRSVKRLLQRLGGAIRRGKLDKTTRDEIAHRFRSFSDRIKEIDV